MSAPWPYEDEPRFVDAHAPSWCGTCVCRDDDVHSLVEFAVELRDHEGGLMPGARCRVLLGGRVVNDDQPNADGDAIMHVRLDRAASTVRVEWAPPQTPLAPIYPYRKSYFVDVDHPQREERARRRLHNLGFSSRKDLRGNVAEYQRQYGYPRITGELDDIERELIAFHDQHIEPPPKAPLPDDETEGQVG